MQTTGHIRGRVCSYLRKRGITGAFHRPLPTICSSSLSLSTPSPSSRNFTNTTTCLQGKDPSNRVADFIANTKEEDLPLGGKAFVECDREAVIDLFQKHAVNCDVSGRYLDREGLTQVLRAVGENTDPETVENLFKFTDMKQKGVIELDEFLQQADVILGGAPAKIVLIVGGPGSGKGLLSKRLEKECGVVHLSSGDLLRDEVRRGTPLGKEVEGIMAKGKLVSSAVLVTLMRRAMRNHPGKRVLLDGFPRSIQNAHDLMELCGVPELALHLECDDTILIERILHRASGSESRSDDNIHTALRRLRTFHKYHDSTMEWLRKQHVPVVNLDCSGTPENVWEQLSAIGRLMRPATRLTHSSLSEDSGFPFPSTPQTPDQNTKSATSKDGEPFAAA